MFSQGVHCIKLIPKLPSKKLRTTKGGFLFVPVLPLRRTVLVHRRHSTICWMDFFSMYIDPSVKPQISRGHFYNLIFQEKNYTSISVKDKSSMVKSQSTTKRTRKKWNHQNLILPELSFRKKSIFPQQWKLSSKTETHLSLKKKKMKTLSHHRFLTH